MESRQDIISVLLSSPLERVGKISQFNKENSHSIANAENHHSTTQTMRNAKVNQGKTADFG